MSDIFMSTVGIPDRCDKPRCLRKSEHDGKCWPSVVYSDSTEQPKEETNEQT